MLIARLRHWTSLVINEPADILECVPTLPRTICHSSRFPLIKPGMSKNLSTTAESNPEVMAGGDEECAYLIFSKHTNGTLVATGFPRPLQVVEFPTSGGVAAQGVDVAMVCS